MSVLRRLRFYKFFFFFQIQVSVNADYQLLSTGQQHTDLLKASPAISFLFALSCGGR
jgi:hypothetical protein